MALTRLAFIILVTAQIALANAPAPSAAAASGAKPAAAAASKAPEPVDPNEEKNWTLLKGLLYSWVVLVGGTTIYCSFLYVVSYMRTVSCLNNATQKFFARPNFIHGEIKKCLIDAPLFRKRHHREFKISRAIDMGTLPSRMQTLFLVSYIGASILLTTIDINWSLPRKNILTLLLRRSGMMAVMNMLPLFLLAGRNNPLLKLTGITFDTYNLIHRWLGRIVIAEVIVHTAVYLVNKVAKGGWASVVKSLGHSNFILSGFVAACAFTAILFQSFGAVRHAFYETFLIGHQLLVGLALGGIWIHLKEFPAQQNMIKGVLAIWAAERAIRLFRLIYGNIGRGGSTAEVEALPGDACRVTVKMARQWRFTTGAHAYLYMPGIGWWMSHPFSVAWSEEADPITEKSLMMDPEKAMPMERGEILSMGETTISFIIRRRTGFTEKLWRKADRSQTGRFTTRCFVEGPYGDQKLHSYGTVLLFAAGVGITHQVPHVRDLVTGYSNGTVAARKVTLVWIIQSPEHLEWIRPWMTTILSLPKRRECLKILLFVTRPRSTKEIHSPSSSVQMFPGKPNIQALIDQEVEQSIGAIGVSVCGVGALADEVRKGCRSWMGKVNIDFFEESFSW